MVRASEDDWLAASWEPVGPEETRTRVFVYVGTQQTSTAAVDFLAIERTLNGDLPRPCLGEEELDLAARVLDAHGESASAIAERLGVKPRTITRWRERWKVAGAA